MFARNGVEFLPPGCILRVDEVTQTLEVCYPAEDGRRVKCTKGEGLSKTLATPVRRATVATHELCREIDDNLARLSADMDGRACYGECDLDDGRAG
jgi:hypothetical protein